MMTNFCVRSLVMSLFTFLALVHQAIAAEKPESASHQQTVEAVAAPDPVE